MLKKILIILFFFIVIAVMTYPVIFKINNRIPGFGSTDEPYGVLWDMWWFRYAYQTGLNYGRCDFIAYPFGVDLNKSIGSSYFWEGIKHGLSLLVNETVAYNLINLSGFFLSLIFMYLLVFYITSSVSASLFSALIFAFCPYHFARAWQHLALSQIQWIPLYVLMLLKLKDNPDVTNALFLAVAFFLVVSFNFYYAYFMLVCTGIFLVYFVFYHRDSRAFFNLLKKIILAYLIVVLLLLPSLYQIYSNRKQFTGAPSGHNTIQRPFEDLFSQSARPLSYILPSTEHPLFGGLAQSFLGTDLYGNSLTEHALYLGWIALGFAFIAFRAWRKKCKQSSTINHQLSAKQESFYIGFFVILAIGAWLFSQPPWWSIGSLKIYMPSFFMYKILPMFRAYARFGIIVMLAVAALAGFGLKFTLTKFKETKTKAAAAVIFCGLVLFESWNYPPFKIIDISDIPSVYTWLKKQPGDFVIAEYPLDINSPNEMYKFYQTKHEKKMIDGTIPGSYANKTGKDMFKLSETNTVARLSKMRVKYVLVHKTDYLNNGLVDDMEELEKIAHNPDLRFLKAFNDIDVYALR